jgi:hypothetical protein
MKYTNMAAIVFIGPEGTRKGIICDYFESPGVHHIKDKDTLMKYGANLFSYDEAANELESIYDRCKGQMCIIQLHKDGCYFADDYLTKFKDISIINVLDTWSASVDDLYVDIVKNLGNVFEYICSLDFQDCQYTAEYKLKR